MADLKAARDRRTAELLRLAADYIMEGDTSPTIFYDGTDCDGHCLAEDLRNQAEEYDGIAND